jgi:beta-N-acetylhexosaminidase
MKPVIVGLESTKLTPAEHALFTSCAPAGYILFGRNISNVVQLKELTSSLRDLHPDRTVPILIDQEGGRVARLRPPVWPEMPSAFEFGELYQISPIAAMEAARSNALAIGLHLRQCGINVNCSPVLDLISETTHSSIGDRSFGNGSIQVASLGRAVLDGLREAGVCGVIKHIPGQGRASADTHFDLPQVDEVARDLESDIAPFKSLCDASFAMTSHTVFTAWDSENCVTQSRRIISDIIREKIGFQGILLSDDITMKALTGNAVERSLASLEAGCDIILHCSGELAEMEMLLAALPDMDRARVERLETALSSVISSYPLENVDALIAKRDTLLAMAA